MPEPLEDRSSELKEVYVNTFGATEALEEMTSGFAKADDLRDFFEVTEAARTASNGSKFEALWNGDASLYVSPSEADLALCRLLWIQSGNRAQVDRLFRRSGLMRDKWDRDDYRGATLDKACNDVLVVFDETREAISEALHESFAPVNLAYIDDPEPIRFTVEGLIVQNRINTLFGDSGQGKSTIANFLALCVATGSPFLDLPVIKGNVLSLDWELDLDVTQLRMYQLSRGLGLNRPPEIKYQSLNSSLEIHYGALVEWIDQNRPELVIFDSFGPAAGGDPMNQELAVKLMGLVRQLKTTVLLVDHQANLQAGKAYNQQRPFGSAWKTHLTRSSVQLQAVSSVPGKLSVVARHQKVNFGPRLQDIPIHVLFDDQAIRVVRAPDSAEEFQKNAGLSIPQRLGNFLKTKKGEEFTVKELAEEIKAKESSIRNALGRLRTSGLASSQEALDERELKWQWAG